MNKYQDDFIYTSKSALNALERDGVFLKYVGSIPKIDDERTLKHYSRFVNIIKKDLHKLEELTKTPTIEEVKKEWEKLGYEFELYSNKIELINSSKNNEIIIWFNPNYYDCGNSISLKEHQLLTKTFKALGWGGYNG